MAEPTQISFGDGGGAPAAPQANEQEVAVLKQIKAAILAGETDAAVQLIDSIIGEEEQEPAEEEQGMGSAGGMRAAMGKVLAGAGGAQ